MLTGIEQRDRSLHDAHDRLEARVRERTEELEATNQELESFSYSVSHDLRAPLRHIGGFANLLNQHAAATLDEKGRRYVTTILDSSARMGQLIDDLLAFSRMGRTAIAKQAVDLNVLVDGVRREVSMDAPGRMISWQIQPLPVVDADPALLRAAVVNLLSNAVKYTAAREVARIDVAAEQAEGEVVISVRDNGAGFDMAYVHKLFGVFQRLHAANEFAGTGIGLANVRRIIQRHGGRAWAVGEVGVGATFYFSLPAAAGASEPARHHAVA
jgi:light-regulated signal transduction histidine kinase (bacteriophytochrome)